jgi:transposase
MRKGFDGLCGLVRNELGREPDCGNVFIFMSRDRRALKLLHWEPGGFVLYYKRLEQGTFALPKVQGKSGVLLYAHLVLLIEGLKLETKVEKKRFKR